MRKKNKKIYALYKGDKFIDLGTKEEIAKRIGVQPYTIYYYSTEAYKKKRTNSENAIVVIVVEDDLDNNKSNKEE